jgi:glycosyltransferase involved in cell wall biosynthesis
MTSKILDIGYISKSLTTHDQRFLSALDEIFTVNSYFLENLSIEKELTNFEGRLLVASPLSTGLNAIADSELRPVIGICLAYELNEESKNELVKKEIIKNVTKCVAILCDSKFIASRLRNEFKFKGPVMILPFGCDQEYFLDIAFLESEVLTILSTRNWTSTHSNGTLISALNKLNESDVEFQALMMGTGPLLTPATIKSGERIGIKFGGLFDFEILRKKFQLHQIYVSTSLSDGSSVSLLEALSSGRICICRDFPSNREWIKDGTNGFLFKDDEELASILIHISRMNHEDKMRFSSNARLSVIDRANWKNNKIVFQNFIQKEAECHVI